ncbi:hypothetical protein [Nostoc sp. C052]|nr:hypothetical protein [Nostoc sp. C052]
MKRLMLLVRRSPEKPLQLADCDSFLVRCLRQATLTHSSTIKGQS